MSVPDTFRHGLKKVIFEDYELTGYNCRMTDIQAAVGIEQLKKIDAIVEERRYLAARYEDLLSDLKYLMIPKAHDAIRPNWQSYPVKRLKEAPCNQLELMQFLLDKGIATRRGIMNAHQEPPYKLINWSLPNSELCRDNTVLIPLYSNIGMENLKFISDSIHEIMDVKK
jgi:dTDP-4-amino-4,6-dideoxygalactose transaminase